MRPIPKTLLIHAVTQAREGEADRWGNGGLTGEQELQHVRMEPSSKVIRDKRSSLQQHSSMTVGTAGPRTSYFRQMISSSSMGRGIRCRRWSRCTMGRGSTIMKWG